jgi:MtN3 and saliva related transmembrane protein
MLNTIDIWQLIGIAAALLTSFGFLPQVMKMMRTRHTKDISVVTLIQFTFGVLLWFIYGLHNGYMIIMIANLITLFILLVAMGLYLKYR